MAQSGFPEKHYAAECSRLAERPFSPACAAHTSPVIIIFDAPGRSLTPLNFSGFTEIISKSDSQHHVLSVFDLLVSTNANSVALHPVFNTLPHISTEKEPPF